MKQHILAISGPDNVGESTRLRILARRIPNRVHRAGLIHEHDPRWDAVMREGLTQWRFEDAPLPEFVDVLTWSYPGRHRNCSMSGL